MIFSDKQEDEEQIVMDPLLLTATEAAEVLHISRTKVFELKSQNRLKYIKIGQALRFRPSDLEEFVQDLADSAAKEASKHKFNLP